MASMSKCLLSEFPSVVCSGVVLGSFSSEFHGVRSPRLPFCCAGSETGRPLENFGEQSAAGENGECGVDSAVESGRERMRVGCEPVCCWGESSPCRNGSCNQKGVISEAPCSLYPRRTLILFCFNFKVRFSSVMAQPQVFSATFALALMRSLATDETPMSVAVMLQLQV